MCVFWQIQFIHRINIFVFFWFAIQIWIEHFLALDVVIKNSTDFLKKINECDEALRCGVVCLFTFTMISLTFLPTVWYLFVAY